MLTVTGDSGRPKLLPKTEQDPIRTSGPIPADSKLLPKTEQDPIRNVPDQSPRDSEAAPETEQDPMVAGIGVAQSSALVRGP